MAEQENTSSTTQSAESLSHSRSRGTYEGGSA